MPDPRAVRQSSSNSPVEDPQLWQNQTVDGRWICPYCLGGFRLGQTAPHAVQKAMRSHLGQCESYAGGQGITHELTVIQHRTHLLNIEFHARNDRAWQVFDHEGYWYSPCSLERIEAVQLNNRRFDASTVHRMAEHLLACPYYRQGIIHGVERVQQVRDLAAKAISLARNLKRVVAQKIWQYRDSAGAWVCPYCLEHIPSVPFGVARTWDPILRAMAQHLIAECAIYPTNPREIRSEQAVQNSAAGEPPAQSVYGLGGRMPSNPALQLAPIQADNTPLQTMSLAPTNAALHRESGSHRIVPGTGNQGAIPGSGTRPAVPGSGSGTRMTVPGIGQALPVEVPGQAAGPALTPLGSPALPSEPAPVPVARQTTPLPQTGRIPGSGEIRTASGQLVDPTTGVRIARAISGTGAYQRHATEELASARIVKPGQDLSPRLQSEESELPSARILRPVGSRSAAPTPAKSQPTAPKQASEVVHKHESQVFDHEAAAAALDELLVDDAVATDQDQGSYEPIASEELTDELAVEEEQSTASDNLSWMDDAEEEFTAITSSTPVRNTEMLNAKDVQQQLLRDCPELPGYRFSTRFESANEVSGDFYEFIHLPEGRIGFALGDVSGHGVGAGLIMSMAKKVFSIYARQGVDPTAVLSEVNEALAEDLGGNRFISMTYAILDPAARTITWTRAGHNPTLLFNIHTREMREIKPPGMVVGMKSGPVFHQSLKTETSSLRSGDFFLLYTDGINETMNRQGDEYGIERLRHVIEDHGALDIEHVLDRIMDSVRQFRGGGESEDDTTLLGLAVE